jgi:hypothetical protein
MYRLYEFKDSNFPHALLRGRVSKKRQTDNGDWLLGLAE